MRKTVLLVISIVVLVIIFLATLIPPAVAQSQNKIAIMPLFGSIAGTTQASLLEASPGITPTLVKSYLSRAEHDSSVKAIVLRVDSPGGTVAASAEIADMVKEFKLRTAKPVVVSMGDMAASGGYYISANADRIVAESGTTTGSIGVIMQITDTQGLMDKLGITVKTLTAPQGGYKDISNVPDSVLQDQLNGLYDDFVAAVAAGRHLPENQVRTLATGQTYTGKQAKDLGLVDALGGLDDATSIAADLAGVSTYTREWYGTTSSFLNRILQLVESVGKLRSPTLSDDQLAFLRAIEGWQAVPRY